MGGGGKKFENLVKIVKKDHSDYDLYVKYVYNLNKMIYHETDISETGKLYKNVSLPMGLFVISPNIDKELLDTAHLEIKEIFDNFDNFDVHKIHAKEGNLKFLFSGKGDDSDEKIHSNKFIFEKINKYQNLSSLVKIYLDIVSDIYSSYSNLSLAKTEKSINFYFIEYMTPNTGIKVPL